MKNLRVRMVWMVLVVALAVSASSAVAGTLGVEQSAPAAAPVLQEAAVAVQAPVPAVETKAVPAEGTETSAAETVNVSLAAPNAEAACSPPPQCFRDRDCDRICGKGNGVCVRINSCYRACACAS